MKKSLPVNACHPLTEDSFKGRYFIQGIHTSSVPEDWTEIGWIDVSLIYIRYWLLHWLSVLILVNWASRESNVRWNLKCYHTDGCLWHKNNTFIFKAMSNKYIWCDSNFDSIEVMGFPVKYRDPLCISLPEASFGLRVLSLPVSVCVSIPLSVHWYVCLCDNSSPLQVSFIGNIIWHQRSLSTLAEVMDHYIDGLVQERCISSALTMELPLSCTNPSTLQHQAITLTH